jgi:hypothetical protein
MREREALKATAKTMFIGIALVIVGMAILLQASNFGAAKIDRYNETQIGNAIYITCQEDMPCWNCETMGNRICGKPKDNG